MNHWHIYEYLKQIYMRTGRVPTYLEVKLDFPTLRAAVILEGMQEFRLTVGKFEKGA